MSTHKDTSNPSGRVPERLIDDALDAYDAWSQECTKVRNAYSRWSRASRADAGREFAAYTSALDREEHAAHRYRTVAARVRADVPELTAILRERTAS